MTDLIASGAAWLSGQLKEHVSQSVTLRRGVQSTSGISATIGNTTFEAHDEVGSIVQIQSRDYLIEAADYAIAGQATLPRRDDVIVESDGSEFEVLPIEGVYWRWSDPYRTRLRVHTKQVKVG